MESDNDTDDVEPSRKGAVVSEHDERPSVAGYRLGGALSFESRQRDGVEPRRRHVYVCELGHSTSVVFHAKAQAPLGWDCSMCPLSARLEGTGPTESEGRAARAGRSHWDRVRSRRTDAELEALLGEALEKFRNRGSAS